jgi:steroid 5-alpha reductase family enzyme
MFFDLWFTIGATVFALVTGLWLLSLALRDSSIVDVFWGAGFVVIAAVAAVRADVALHDRGWLLLAMVTLWGMRLAGYLLGRNWGRGEDFRYRAWREQAGPSWWWRSYGRVFLLQGAVMWVVAAPLVAVLGLGDQPGLGWLDAVGLVVWAVGFFFEAVGDWQLATFKADPANSGRVLSWGVWRYTRHPNYFGDAAVWWGFFGLAAAAGGWWTAFSPVLMTVLLLRVSGVTLLETTLAERKAGYRDYIASTSPFIPMPPRRTCTARAGAAGGSRET